MSGLAFTGEMARLQQQAGFTFDTQVPTAYVVSPPNKGSFNTQSGLSGTSTDNVGVSTISLIETDGASPSSAWNRIAVTTIVVCNRYGRR